MEQAVIKNHKFQKYENYKFSLYIAMASIVMMFAAFSSAYMVRQAAGNWLEFPLPNLFYVSTGVLLLSSVVLHGSYLSFQRKMEGAYKTLLVLALVLGIAFIVTQYQAWLELYDMGIGLKRNPSSSFIYVISGVHAAHVLGGIACLIVACIHGFFLPFVPTPKRKNRLQLVLYYWHFVDVLWIYLLLFFILQQ